ncbi:ribose-5-phosphate isomerase A [Sphingobacterium sp. LRF_L2]|uniref:ribose-5-phosphate isomerase A n=1 Tax=Sphingobacterium sp. LRF_L2 TaxID=3369421 RepID=UPI003F5E2BA5
MIDLKEIIAHSALDQIQEGQRIGLGSGRTIMKLVDILVKKNKLISSLVLCSSCPNTITMLRERDIYVQPLDEVDHLHIYFDGCDQLDSRLNAFKSGGIIFSNEKILASCAENFVLLAECTKYIEKLDHTFPFSLEVASQAKAAVFHQLRSVFPDANIHFRMSSDPTETVNTVTGNPILDIRFKKLPELERLNELKSMAGIIDHSLFYALATKAILAGPSGLHLLKK